MSRKLVEITWDDAAQFVGPWDDIDALLSKEGRRFVRVRTVGFVLADDKRGIVLAASVHDDRAGGVQIIPRGSIVSRRKLR